jgi:Ca-activated chloride channel family protein
MPFFDLPTNWDFAAPDRLWLLIAVAAVAGAYVWLQLRRSQYELRFSDVDLLASVLPKRPGWRRHLPAALLILTFAALTTGFAKPSADVKVKRDKATVIVTLDTSASMTAMDVTPTRIEAAKAAAQQFIRGLPANFSVGLVSFSGSAVLITPPSLDKSAVAGAVGALQLGGGTAIGDAVGVSVRAAQAFRDAGNNAPVRIVLLSDGGNTVGQSVQAGADQAVAAGMPVTTIAYGTQEGYVAVRGQIIPVPVDRATLSALAKATGGQQYEALSSKALKDVYRSISKEAGTTTKRKELTAAMTGLGLLLGLSAAAASLIWFRVLP